MKIEKKILITGLCFWIPLVFLVSAKTGYFAFDLNKTYQWAKFVSDWVYNLLVLSFVIMIGLLSRKKKGEFIKCLLIMLIIAIFVNLCKYVFFVEIFPRPNGCIGGFPSGHSFTSFAIAFLFAANFPKLWFPTMATAFLISWSRIYAGGKVTSFIFSKEFYIQMQNSNPYHYPYQVIWGSIMGLITAYLLYVYWDNIAEAFMSFKSRICRKNKSF